MYFITTIRMQKKNPDKIDITRCIGYYETLKGAQSNAIGNAESLCEGGWYKYLVIEQFEAGWYPNVQTEEWYEFSEDGKSSRVIEKPECFRQISGFGIG